MTLSGVVLEGDARADQLRFESDAPTVLAATPDGQLTSGEPGVATLSAFDARGELVDRVDVTVAAITDITLRTVGVDAPTVLLAGYEHGVLVQLSAGGRLLLGTGDLVLEGDGLTVGSSDAYDSDVFVTGTTEGEAVLTARGGVAETHLALRVVAPEAVDRVELDGGWAAGGGDDRVAVRYYVSAFSGADRVAGARCAWEPSGATVGLDSMGSDGRTTTDFWTADATFSVTCVIGSYSEHFDLTVPPDEG